MKKSLCIILLFVFIACKNNDPKPSVNNPDAPKSISYSIVNTYPHDTSSFTEGLLIYKGDMYESTGEYGTSRLIKADVKTGKALQSIDLDKKYFGEGIAIVNDTVYQLTFKEKVCFMYSLKDFKKLGEFNFNTKSGEGWGMTTDGKNIIVTDGSSQLYYYEPGTFHLIKTQDVTDGGNLAFNLNEIEYINGYIYANQWQAPYVLKINPANGAIVSNADLTSMWDRIKAIDPKADVPNGIAYDSAAKKIYITGKWWPELYEIQFGE